MKRILISCLITLVVFSAVSFAIAQISQIDILSCDDFISQPEAQEKFASDPMEFADLDPDFDGRVCETLPSEPEPVANVAVITEEIDNLVCGKSHQALVDWIYHQIDQIDDDPEAATLMVSLATKESVLTCRPRVLYPRGGVETGDGSAG